MNLPVINNKMKNLNNPSKQDNNLFSQDGFGLGIQVFKIESVKNIDANLKSKNRTMIKNIQNPNQNINFKPSLIPKPKKLPSLQKSKSQINPKQRISAFLHSKAPSDISTGYSDKIMERKTPSFESKTIVTPVSYSMRKKVGVSTEKKLGVSQTSKQGSKQSFIIPQYKQKIVHKQVSAKMNQTAPPQVMYKQEQTTYYNYHTQHNVLINFYAQYQNGQKQNVKQIKQLKKLKQNEQSQDIFDRIEYLQSMQGKIETTVQNMEKQEFDTRLKQLQRFQDKKGKKMINTIMPITGFPMPQMDSFEFDSIQNYQLGDYSGGFNVKTYQNVDFAPSPVNISKDQQ